MRPHSINTGVVLILDMLSYWIGFVISVIFKVAIQGVEKGTVNFNFLL